MAYIEHDGSTEPALVVAEGLAEVFPIKGSQNLTNETSCSPTLIIGGLGVGRGDHLLDGRDRRDRQSPQETADSGIGWQSPPPDCPIPCPIVARFSDWATTVTRKDG